MDIPVFEEINLFDVITFFRTKKQFGDVTVSIEHDVLGLVSDFVVIEDPCKPGIVFASKTNPFIESKALNGRRLSFATFSMTNTGDVFEATDEIVTWVKQVVELMQANTIKFTKVVQ